jgi:hypothetical protein
LTTLSCATRRLSRGTRDAAACVCVCACLFLLWFASAWQGNTINPQTQSPCRSARPSPSLARTRQPVRSCLVFLRYCLLDVFPTETSFFVASPESIDDKLFFYTTGKRSWSGGSSQASTPRSHRPWHLVQALLLCPQPPPPSAYRWQARPATPFVPAHPKPQALPLLPMQRSAGGTCGIHVPRQPLMVFSLPTR